MSKLLKKNGKFVTKNGKLVRTDDPAKCECCGSPPPPQWWCCDGGTEGYFCGERVNVPGIGEMIGDAPIGICNSVKKVDDCSECGPPPPVVCGTLEVTRKYRCEVVPGFVFPQWNAIEPDPCAAAGCAGLADLAGPCRDQDGQENSFRYTCSPINNPLP